MSAMQPPKSRLKKHLYLNWSVPCSMKIMASTLRTKYTALPMQFFQILSAKCPSTSKNNP